MSNTTETEPTRVTPIPEAVSEQLQTAQRLNEQPATLYDWGTMIGDIVSREDIDVGLNALCTTEESPHSAQFDGTTQHFICVQDAFIVPAVVENVDTVEIETESPVSGTQIEVTVTDDGVQTDPSGAVMSVGVALAISEPPADADTVALSYGQICPYGHAFVDRTEYEEWAETVDAVTMVAPLESAFELAQGIHDATE